MRILARAMNALRRGKRAIALVARVVDERARSRTNSRAFHASFAVNDVATRFGDRREIWNGRAIKAMTTTTTTTRRRWEIKVRGYREIFIQTQTTPNPMSMMFQPGKEVYADGSKNFSSAREAMRSPLARKLFAIDGVTNVFFGSDFVTVTKSDSADWANVKPQTFEAIMNFYASGEPILDEARLEASGTAIHEDDDEIVAMIKELLETRIRPAVAEDGGDIVFKSFNPDNGLVTVQLQGSCDGCPSSSVTLKSGIENMLMHYVPEVKGVVQATDEKLDLLDLADLHRGR